jgi:hypothetical protein
MSTNSPCSSIPGLVLLWVLGPAIFCSGQVQQIARVEIPLLAEGNDHYSVTPAQHAGLVVSRKLSGPEFDQLEVIRYDTSLRELWKGYV